MSAGARRPTSMSRSSAAARRASPPRSVAARCGARTLLVERSDILGGNVGNAFVHTICGLYQPAGEETARHAHPGFPQQFAEGLRAAGAAGSAERAGRVYVLPIQPPAFARVRGASCAPARRGSR